MYRTLFKFAVTAITILTVNLLTNKISDYLISYKSHYSHNPIKFTLIAMGIITVIFYPLFTRMEDWLNTISAKLVRSGKSLGGKYIGLFVVFFLCLAVLLYFYTKMWYKIDLVHVLFKGNLKANF